MGRLRYIGSKARIVHQILDIIGSPSVDWRFFDVFSGTGVVSQEAAIRGWQVVANDHLVSSSILTTARLLSVKDVFFPALGNYGKTIELLNRAFPISGFIYQEYTPSGQSASGHERRYFSEDNGRKIDGIRNQIKLWEQRGLLKEFEKQLLIADLLEATNRVANIAGTYGCFLREWTKPALGRILLMPRQLLSMPTNFRVLCQDAFKLRVEENDLVYLDPPYTKRQYAAYYHILETIAVGDDPSVSGVTGLRPWEHKSSPFCYKKHALGALLALVSNLQGKRTIISYSSEGHISLSELERTLREYGKVIVHEVAEIGRYRPNQKALRNSNVKEYLVEFVTDSFFFTKNISSLATNSFVFHH